MAQTVASVIKDDDTLDKDTVSTDFQSAIARALNDLSATSENLQVVHSKIIKKSVLYNLLHLETHSFMKIF